MISTGYKTNTNSSSKKDLSPGDSLYRSNADNERLFKKSVDKIKRTFFTGLRDNREVTIKTLKKIGENAKYRAEHKPTIPPDS